MQTTVTRNAGPAGNLHDASREWASRPADQRFASIDALLSAVSSRRDRSFVKDYDLGQLMAQPVGDGLQLMAGNRALDLTHWSFGQLASCVGAPAAYLRKLPVELAARNLNHGLEATRKDTGKRDENRLLMINRPDDPSMPLSMPVAPPYLAALTSKNYGRIWDADVVRMVQGITARHPQFHNPLAYDYRSPTGKTPAGLYASDRDCFLFLIDGGSVLEVGKDARGNPDVLNRGFFCWNSETANATFGFQSFLFRAVCGNHIVWGASDVTTLRIRHSKGGPSRFEDEALPSILDFVQSSAAGDEAAIARAQAFVLPPQDSDLTALVARVDLTKAELRTAIDYARREEGDCRTLWQLLNGFTASARDLAFVDARIELERRASKLLSLAQ